MHKLRNLASGKFIGKWRAELELARMCSLQNVDLCLGKKSPFGPRPHLLLFAGFAVREWRSWGLQRPCRGLGGGAGLEWAHLQIPKDGVEKKKKKKEQKATDIYAAGRERHSYVVRVYQSIATLLGVHGAAMGVRRGSNKTR